MGEGQAAPRGGWKIKDPEWLVTRSCMGFTSAIESCPAGRSAVLNDAHCSTNRVSEIDGIDSGAGLPEHDGPEHGCCRSGVVSGSCGD
jgi:hypothetical protein